MQVVNPLIQVLKESGKSDEEIVQFFKTIQNIDVANGNIDEIAHNIANGDIGTESEENVLNSGGEENLCENIKPESEFSNGQVYETENSTLFSSHGSLDQPIVKIDYKQHRLIEDEILECYNPDCGNTCCKHCSVRYRNKYDLTTRVICHDCFTCHYCNNKLNWHNKINLKFVRDDLENIVKAYHVKCYPWNRLKRMFFHENKE